MNLCKYLHLYTGDGKGKSSIALGLAMRAVAHNKSVRVIRLFKERGKETTLMEISGIRVMAFFSDAYTGRDRITRGAVGSFLEELLPLYPECDVTIVDEALIALRDGLATEEQLLTFFYRLPTEDLILTGRCPLGAMTFLIVEATTVSQVQEIKHPYPIIKARAGIDY